MRNRALIVSVLIVASCGLGYELIGSALASYLLGDSILQFSTVIGCYLFAMGLGSWASRYVPDDEVLNRFVDLEMLIGLVGGLSAAILFVVFAWVAMPFRTALYAFVFIIGFLVGMEIPLVMRVFERERVVFRELVSRVLAFDYLGALVVSLLFPLLFAPHLGLLRTAFLFGMLNTAVACWTVWAFRRDISQSKKRLMRSSVIFSLLLAGFLLSPRITGFAEGKLFSDDVLYSETTPYQRLVVTRWKNDLRLYINNNLQFSSTDEHRYHESLVHPGLSSLPWAKRVLVLGGGDGLAVREILKYPNIEAVTLVDLDPAMTRLFMQADFLTELNQHALTDRRVTVINQDAGHWLEQHSEFYDFIVIDFPDPSNFGLGRLYSVSMFELVKKHLAHHGRLVVQSTSPYFAPQAYWTVNSTLKEAGLYTWPYHTYVPSFGEWGFILAGPKDDYQVPDTLSVPLRYLDPPTMKELFHFPKDMSVLDMSPNRLNDQSLVRIFESEWRQVIR